MFDGPVIKRLDRMFDGAPIIDLSSSDRMLVLSDLHMGDGSSCDGFRRTSRLLSSVLERYYYENGFDLVLNGDVEDLLRAPYERIREAWKDIYSVFDLFMDGTSLKKIFGNHDIWHLWISVQDMLYDHYEALRLRMEEGVLFLYHGHQASRFVERMYPLQEFMFNRVANSVRIKNPSLKLFRDDVRTKERRIMEHCAKRGVLSLVAHTHRPSFGGLFDGMYNSGCSTGKRGITALEIEGGRLSLVHWWDRNILGRHIAHAMIDSMELGGADCYRVVLDSAPLKDLFRAVRA